MKKIIFAVLLLSTATMANAQYEKEEKGSGGFKKENLFTGGGIILSFSNYNTILGASPVFGYSVSKWLDAGILFNYTYSAQRHLTYYDPNSGLSYMTDDRLRQTTLGPGAFFRIYPVNFLFVQAQGEFNATTMKVFPANGGAVEKTKVTAPSFLVGAGYCSGREGSGTPFYYLSVMFDIAKDKNSPYVEVVSGGRVNILPIIKAGLQIPLFQGGRDRGYSRRRD